MALRLSGGVGPVRVSVPVVTRRGSRSAVMLPFWLMWWMTVYFIWWPMRLLFWDLPRWAFSRRSATPVAQVQGPPQHRR